MVAIQSKEVIDKISDELKVQPSLDIPRELSKNIQLVYGVNPPIRIRTLDSTASDSTSSTILTTSTTKRTFLVGVQITTAKDVVSTSIISAILATPIGDSSRTILATRYEPVTAGSNIMAQNTFNSPMELEPGTTVTVINGTAIASIDTSGLIFFYETDQQ